MIYEVEVSEQADRDLREIFLYIAFELQSPENAIGQLDRLEEQILSLDAMPKRYRKLSDYKFIVFAFGASDDDIRSIVTVPRVIFEKIGKSYSFVAHGSNDSTISAVSFTYASDTATTVKLSADHGVKYIRVFGIK